MTANACSGNAMPGICTPRRMPLNGGALVVTAADWTPGIVRMRCRGLNQDDVCVIEFERTFLLYKRSADPRSSRQGDAGAGPGC